MEGQTGHSAQQTQLVAQTGTWDGADVLIAWLKLPGPKAEAVVR